ncbi:hypothetical protein OIU76_017197 [Salix suchowensis]|uniref:Peptidase A1 domain-containing protein n=1 Tax=Salix suchowensis TaxID=1278906 RepID=A0ABQ9C3I0_9ROSI|nr:hypothetical protein OIU76_017197 [Salix suchowensis]KAJ6392828.1 hypothetical protein OIU77_022331 [Salix suchowensis]
MSPEVSFVFHFFLSSMLLGCIAAVQLDGLTMELIHRDSPQSPLHPGNLPLAERIPKPSACPFAGLHRQTSMVSARKAAANKMISPLTSYGDPFLFFAQVGVGSFQEKSGHPRFKTYNFQIDTGNELSWIQCDGCQNKGNMCFPHEDPPYLNSQSRSYKPISCNQHSFCEPGQCKEGMCTYNVTYGPGSYTSGNLASETFTFYSSHGKHAALEDITFGCSTDSRNMKYAFLFDKNPVSGVLGMGWGPRSFLAQLGSISHGKFSYCIKANNTQNTYLRFGKHIVKSKNLQTTRIMQVKPSAAYHVNLLGISVNGVKLNITKSDLAVRKDGSRGCSIDAGTLATLLVKPVFDTLHAALADHLSRNQNLKRWIIHKLHKDLCYEQLSDAGRENLPVVTFHLENADLEVKPGAIFLFREFEGKNVFCLSMLSDDSKTIIGAYQQMKQKFVYDTKARVLSFGPEDCEKNG